MTTSSVQKKPVTGKTVALVLGSGGARGYAHIGLLDALAERGYRVTGVSGSSMGAVIGGFFAAGRLDDYRQWVSGLGYIDVIKLLDVSLGSGGLIRGDKVFATMSEMLGGLLIEDLAIPFTAVATDLTHHKEVWFHSGPLEIAIRASAAIPSVFHPVQAAGATLVDGGVLNPLPVSSAALTPADLTIAMDLNADTPVPDSFGARDQNGSEEKYSWFKPVIETANQWLGMAPDADVHRRVNQEVGKLEQVSRSLELMQRSLTRFKLAGYPPDLLIRLPMEACDLYEFYRAEEMIELGYQIAHEALEAYEAGKSSLYGQCL